MPVTLLIIVFFICLGSLLINGCTKAGQKNVTIKSDELGISFNKTLDTLIVLDEGSHAITKDESLYIYSLENEIFEEEIIVQTKDNNYYALLIKYIYAINPDNIIDLHKEFGQYYFETYLKPEIRDLIRYKVITYEADPEDAEILSESILTEIKNHKGFSQLFNSISFEIIEISNV